MSDKRANLTAAEAEKLSETELAELLQAQVKAKQTALIEALAQSSNKAVSRAAKKAAYQLKSSGVAVEAKKAEPKAAAAAKKEEWPALFTVTAGTGDLGMYVVRPQRGGGLSAWRAVTQDEAGIVLFERLAFNRGGYRKSIKAVIAEGKAYEVPFEKAKEELGRGLALNEKFKNPLPQGAAETLMMLGVEKIDEPLTFEQPSKEDEAAAAKSASLHDEREMAEWLPSPQALQILDQRVQEVLNSPLALTEVQKREQFDQKANLCADEYFSLVVRRLYAGRLQKIGEFFSHTARPASAALAQSTARVIANRPGPTPFGQKLFSKVIDASLAAQAEAAAAAAAAAGSADAPRLAPPVKRSPGGLVLP